MRFLDPNHPFFRPVWVRWLTALLPMGWATFEMATGNVGWAILFGAAGAYAFYELVIHGPSDG